MDEITKLLTGNLKVFANPCCFQQLLTSENSFAKILFYFREPLDTIIFRTECVVCNTVSNELGPIRKIQPLLTEKMDIYEIL